MSEQYSEIILDHFNNPRNMGEIDNPDAIGDAGNPMCGDLMRITLRIAEDTERITDIRFKARGCPASIACSSVLTELVKGRTIEEALRVSNEIVAEKLGGLPPDKMHCSLLAEQGIAIALYDYYGRQSDNEMPEELREKIAKLQRIDAYE